MRKRLIKNLIISGSLLIFSVANFIVLPTAYAADKGTYDFKKQSGLNVTAGEAGYDIGREASSLETIISSIIYAFLGLVGIIFFGLIIYSGFIWMTAQGNEEKAKKATDIIFSALFGLIITLAAYAISYMAINYFWK